jgi:hypothetical protein
MKNLGALFVTLAALGFLWAGQSLAGEMTAGVVTSLSGERLSILSGEKAIVSVGEREGIIKGDIGFFTADKQAASRDVFDGECAIIKNGRTSSVCEAIKVKREVETESAIVFPKVRYTDPNYFPIIISILSKIVDPFEPHERVRTCMYGVFDGQNAVTGLSRDFEKEFREIASQKPRLQIVDTEEIKNIVVYPKFSRQSLDLLKSHVKKAKIDALILGDYAISGQQVKLRIMKIGQNDNDRSYEFSFPLADKYNQLAAKVVVPAQEITKVEQIPLSISALLTMHEPQREEKFRLIKEESAGNPFIEMNMKRLDFNILSPVDVVVKVDEETVLQEDRKERELMLPKGLHRISASFRRGYFSNESLIYTSENKVAKEVFLDARNRNKLIVEVLLDPLAIKEAVSVKVYEQVEKQRHVLKPIQVKRTETTIETYKD